MMEYSNQIVLDKLNDLKNNKCVLHEISFILKDFHMLDSENGAVLIVGDLKCQVDDMDRRAIIISGKWKTPHHFKCSEGVDVLTLGIRGLLELQEYRAKLKLI